MRFIIFIFFTMCWMGVSGQGDIGVNNYKIRFSFKNKVGNIALQLDSAYINPFGESFIVTQFKYYISNISFRDTEGREAQIPNKYFLINERDSASQSFIVSLPINNIIAIRFFIGVDSIKNTSGVQTGALDPANGMFWAWNTGYIMAKLEATSPLSQSPMNRVIYHIGGFQNENNTVKKVTFVLPQILTMKQSNVGEIKIQTDINKWFKGKHDIKISAINFCMNPGPLANKIADNYADMFTITDVINH